MSSHNTVRPRSIHRVPASRCPQCKPFPLDSLVILDLASFHDLYTRVPASCRPRCKPFPLDSLVVLDLKPEPQLPIALNISLSPWTLLWAEADVTSLVLVLPQHRAPKTRTLASESLAPKLPQQWSNLDSPPLPGACQQYKARAASPDGSLRQSQFRWACHPAEIILY